MSMLQRKRISIKWLKYVSEFYLEDVGYLKKYEDKILSIS